MPRSSRHKSHRTHKHSSRDVREQSDSEEDGDSRDRKQKGEEASSEARVSRELDLEKRKPSNGDVSVEHGKKRKDRADDTASADRWNGGGVDDGMVDKATKGEVVGPVDLEKISKSKVLAADSKGRSSRRREGSSDRYEESGGKDESVKRRSEKDSSRRESSSSQYRDGKERDRERGSERDEKIQDSKHERSGDVGSGNQGFRRGVSEEDRTVKDDNAEVQIQDDLRNPELEKELEKRIRRRRGSSGDGDKYQADGRDTDDRRLLSRDDRTKSASYKDERHRGGRHKDESYRDKFQEDPERHRDERSSRDPNSNRSDSKYFRDENKHSDTRSRKSKLHDSDHDGSPYAEDRGIKSKETRGRKRSHEENDDSSDFNLRSSKELHRDMEKVSSNTSKIEFLHRDKVDSSLSNSRLKSSASSGARTKKEQSRHSLKQEEVTNKELLSQESFRPSEASTGDRTRVSGVREIPDSRSSEKRKPNDGINSGELLLETAAASQYDRTPRSDGHISPIRLTEKSPSSTSDRRLSNRSGSRRSVDIEDVGRKSSTSKDGRECSTVDERERESSLDNPVDSQSHANLRSRETIPAVSSSFHRTGHFPGNSPSHLPPPPPVRLGIDSPSVLGSYEDDNRVKIGERKPSNRYKRNGDLNMERGQGNAWKSGPAWPSPVPNGFIPFQHGPPPPGFHSAIQQFPASTLFGMRPSMEMNYHIHEMAGRPFGGWRTSVDDSCPQLQGWDRSNSVFADESQVYGRRDWDQNRHLMGSQGWDMSAAVWKGQSGSINMEFAVPQKEPENSTCTVEGQVGLSGSLSCDESIEMKQSSNLPGKNAFETPLKTIVEKTTEPSIKDTVQLCCSYLSKLDISLNLVGPDLYEQCMTLLATRDPHDACNVFKQGDAQNIKESSAKRHNVSSLFPTTSDAIFQKAVSIYEKQTERKVKIPHIDLPSKEQRDSSEASYMEIEKAVDGRDEQRDSPEAYDSEKEKAVDSQSERRDSPDGSDMEKVEALGSQSPENLSANATSAGNLDRNTITTDANGEEGDIFIADAAGEEGNNIGTDAGGEIPDHTKEQQQAELISDVVFAEGAQACEPLMPECRVNISRIHNSPESTH